MPVLDGVSFGGVPAGVYHLSVRAFNESGASGPSNTVTLTVPGSCAVPSTPTGFVAVADGTTIALSWAPPDSGPAPTGYVVVVRGSVVADIPTTARTLAGPVAPGQYIISVMATTPCGASAATATRTLVVP